jgi:hypothetical protein
VRLKLLLSAFLLLQVFCTSSQAEPIALYRFWDGTYHFYTEKCDERAEVKKHLKEEGITGYIENKEIPGTTKLFRLSRDKGYFYTVNPQEKDIAINAHGYKDEGIVGFISTTKGNGQTELYRAFKPKTNAHFYTANANEYELAVSALKYEKVGIVGYIWRSGTKCPE